MKWWALEGIQSVWLFLLAFYIDVNFILNLIISNCANNYILLKLVEYNYPK